MKRESSMGSYYFVGGPAHGTIHDVWRGTDIFQIEEASELLVIPFNKDFPKAKIHEYLKMKFNSRGRVYAVYVHRQMSELEGFDARMIASTINRIVEDGVGLVE